MQEVWRPVVGRPDYQVSNLGRVRSPRQLLKPTWDGRYYSVKIGRKRSLHVVVAEAWLGPRPEGQHVCHGTNGVHDNSVSNLYYGTPKRNAADKRRDGTAQIGTRNGANKLTEQQVLEIRAIGSSMKQRDLAAKYGVSQRTVAVILRRLGWKHLEPAPRVG